MNESLDGSPIALPPERTIALLEKPRNAAMVVACAGDLAAGEKAWARDNPRARTVWKGDTARRAPAARTEQAPNNQRAGRRDAERSTNTATKRARNASDNRTNELELSAA